MRESAGIGENRIFFGGGGFLRWPTLLDIRLLSNSIAMYISDKKHGKEKIFSKHTIYYTYII